MTPRIVSSISDSCFPCFGGDPLDTDAWSALFEYPSGITHYGDSEAMTSTWSADWSLQNDVWSRTSGTGTATDNETMVRFPLDRIAIFRHRSKFIATDRQYYQERLRLPPSAEETLSR